MSFDSPLHHTAVPRIDRDWLKAKIQLVQTMHPEMEMLGHVVSLAHRITINFLGPNWWKLNCYKAAPGGYFRPKCPAGEGNFRRQDREIRFADALYRLQDAPAFAQFVQELKNPSNLESKIFELEAARTLSKVGANVEFIIRTGTTGRDFDLQIDLQGVKVPVETKCRIEDSALTANPLRSQLRKARDQLPESGPGIIFFKLPDSWQDIHGWKDVVELDIQNFFRNSQRVNAVFIFWAHWFTQGSGMGRAEVYDFIINGSPRVHLPDLERLLPKEAAAVPYEKLTKFVVDAFG